MWVENIRVHDGVSKYHTQSPLSEGAERSTLPRKVIFTFLVCNWSSRLTQRVMEMERCSVGGRKRCVITHGTTVNEIIT